MTREKIVLHSFLHQNCSLTSTDAPRDAKVQTANIVAYRKGEDAGPNGGSENYSTNNLNVSSSYAVLDSGYKYQFDRFNDVFRYVPLNGDIAGIAVRSDSQLKHGSHLLVSTVDKLEILLNSH